MNPQRLKLPSSEYFAEYTRTIDSIYAYNSIAASNLVQALQTRQKDLQQTVYLMIGALVAVLTLAIMFAFFIVRGITGRLQEAINIANAIAAGDLTK